jgi:hypothetical protein
LKLPYDHSAQFRAIIVRGRAFNELDDLLQLYAQTIFDIAPCKSSDFERFFNERLLLRIPSVTKKALDNHRTEIAGELFGLYYEVDNYINVSMRTLSLIKTGDQPAFFKDLCSKYQFPSGMNKIDNIKNMIAEGLSIRQFSFLLRVLSILDEKGIFLDKKQVGYYVLNSLGVLTRRASPDEVIAQIETDLSHGIGREIKTPHKAYSYDMQHINEQINLLLLANVIRIRNGCLILNKNESDYISSMASKAMEPPTFDYSKYNLEEPEDRKRAKIDWGIFFADEGDIERSAVNTAAGALDEKVSHSPKEEEPRKAPKELGDEGEQFVYTYELRRVSRVSPRLERKVLMLGAQRGLGFDIQSVLATPEKPDAPIFIEVKSTKRVTAPRLFKDSINLTRNEWVAAESHGKNYYIYRVYFTASGTQIFSIHDPYGKSVNSELYVLPLSYRLDFEESSGHFLDE